MRILFIVPYAPSLIRVRPFQLIRGLARIGHHVVVATLCVSSEDRTSLQNLATDRIQILARRMPLWRSLSNCVVALPTRMPLQSVYSWQPKLARALAKVLHQSHFDIVHVEHLRGALYGTRMKELLSARTCNVRSRIPVVWDSVDCISHLFRQARHQSQSVRARWMTRLELLKTEAFEAWLTGQFDRVLVTSPTDKKVLQQLAFSRGLHDFVNPCVLCNGVDLEYFSAGDQPRDPATVVMTGKMSYHANVTAARHLVKDIMPIVWARRPETRVILAGKDPPRALLALQESFPNSNGNGTGQRVLISGTIPDIRPYLRRTTVAVAPVVYGAGVQNKVLEAMACGAAVVASPQATLALSARQDHDLLVGAGVDTFARQILALVENPNLREKVGRAGRRYVEANHSWTNIAARLETIYREAIGSIQTKHASA